VKRLLEATSLLPVLVLFGVATGSAEATLFVAAVLLLATLLSGRFNLSPALQRFLSGMAIALGIGASQALLPDAPGLASRGSSGFFYGMAALAALLCAGVRRLFARSREARRVGVALEAGALVACGMTRVGAVYPVLACAWFLLALASLRQGEPSPNRPLASHPLPALSVIVLTLAVSSSLGLLLPLGQKAAEARLVRWLSSRFARSGFSDTVRLGSLAGILRSDTIVLRLWGGEGADYLRGAVYDRYTSGYWGAGDHPHLEPVTTGTLPAHEGAVEVRFAGRAERYFAPLGAQALFTPHGRALADKAGTWRPLPGEGPFGYAFERGSEASAKEAPPSPDDLEVPRDLEARLADLSASFTGGRKGPREKVLAIAEALERGFTYDLDAKRVPGEDPVERFLFRSKRGYCEHFASALALLVRTAGVPARVVGGYRVVERNPVGGYLVVRERDAHTWVEAFLPGEGWRTFDSTPAEPARPMSMAAALSDAFSTSLGRLFDRLRAMSLAETSLVLAAAVALWALVRALEVRRRRLEPGGRVEATAPPILERFLLALARAGYPRQSWESLERLARRIAGEEPEAARLLERYAALRYGGVGDEDALAAAMQACSARIGHPRA